MVPTTRTAVWYLHSGSSPVTVPKRLGGLGLDLASAGPIPILRALSQIAAARLHFSPVSIISNVLVRTTILNTERGGALTVQAT